MRKNKIKKMVWIIAVSVAIIILIGWFFAIRYFNEPARFVASMLKTRSDFAAHPNRAEKYFDKMYLKVVDVKKPAVLAPVHKTDVSSDKNNPVVTLSFSKSVDKSTGANEAIKFYLKRRGFYPWIYWTRIENVKLIDMRYLSDFSNILPKTETSEKNLGDQFSLDGRFEISLENFKKIGDQGVSDQVNKYSFDIAYKNKPLDFKALSIYISLLGEDDLICLKSKKVEISDLSKNSQSVGLTVIGGFCRPKSIKIDKSDASSILINLK